MSDCTKCGKPNRPEAKFCKWCGEAIVSASPFADFIGKKDIEQAFTEFKAKVAAQQQFASMGIKVGLDSLVLGDPGSGKSFIAHKLADIILQARVVSKPPKVIDAADWDDFAGDFEENITKEKDGILLITNAQKLLPKGNTASDVNKLDKLFARMKQSEGIPIVILAGSRNELASFFADNKEPAGLFEFRFDLPSFSIDDLTRLALEILGKKYGIKNINPDAAERLGAHFNWICRQEGNSYSNGRLSENVAEKLAVRIVQRGGKSLEPTDIPDKEIFIPKTEEEILAEMESLIGMNSVKEELKAIIRTVKKRKEKGMKEKLITDHYRFLGNAGTGKTTFARKFGEILASIGALPTGHFVEVAGKDLIASVVGGSEEKVEKAVEKAMGGVLFIDEAYGLNDEHFGKAALTKLLPIVENRRGDFVCIIAGYDRDMDALMRMNQGLTSRFNVAINFPDYKPQELMDIFLMNLRKNSYDTSFKLADGVMDRLLKVFEKMYLRRGDSFGNAREVRNLFEDAVKKYGLREGTPGFVEDELIYADIVGEDSKEITVEEVMGELDKFIGMDNVKREIRKIAEDLAAEQKMIELGFGEASVKTVNIVLTGNPGTGKTTVARTFGKLFKALGVTSSDKVVEKLPKDIISGFVNQSDKKMDEAINEAMGGVLFLDEAYDLEPMDSTGASTSQEGKKAVAALLGRMENDKGKFVVVCAGYRNKMETWMNSNDGLRSRFTHWIHIDDYSADELLKIYESILGSKQMSGLKLADDTARERALRMFETMISMKDEKFGNAREARKAAEQTREKKNARLRNIPYEQWTEELVTTVIADDVPYKEPEKVSAEKCLEELDALVGLSSVKKAMHDLIDTINAETIVAQKQGRKPVLPEAGHYLFLGNPGTGKTTVARIMGRIFNSMGLLPRADVLETTKRDFVGRFLGDTEALTAAVVKKAMGGVLFIDEAYTLADSFGSGSGYGDIALQSLVDLLENNRGRFVCIAAGYTREMQDFLNSNSGFKSRFPDTNWITFEDYTPDELYQIFLINAKKKGFTVDPDAENFIRGRLTAMYNNRGHDFGNGRSARNLFDEISRRTSARVMKDPDSYSAEEMKTIKMEDVL